MNFDEWFKKEFPDHEDGCLYGKLALKMAWEAAQKEKQKEMEIQIEQAIVLG